VALIELQDVVKRFDERAVLAGVNLAVNEGDVKVVMGPSGCGKSTLLRCINRLVEPTSGSIRFRGQEVTGPGVDVRALRQGIGFVFQQFALYRHLSVIDNVTLALRKLRGMSRVEAESRAMHELNRLGLSAQRDQYPAQISGGQKQRAAIARALAMDPAVVLFDEPTSALDPLMSREVASVIQMLRRDRVTMLCVTHDLNLASEIAERVVFLDRGVVRAEDTIERLSTQHDDARVRDFFRREGSTP
jgi:polar amino acid transport system ATP-binding protein